MLNLYQRGLGQMINNKKLFILFSSNTPLVDQSKVLQEIAGVICGNYDRYLGLPTLIGKSTYNTFRWIKERVWSKISNWNHRFLSQARREILIKAILQALPMFSISVFILPKKLCLKTFGGEIKTKVPKSIG